MKKGLARGCAAAVVVAMACGCESEKNCETHPEQKQNRYLSRMGNHINDSSGDWDGGLTVTRSFCASYVPQSTCASTLSESGWSNWAASKAGCCTRGIGINSLVLGEAANSELPGNTYAHAGENPFADPKTEPLSTFGLDVDTTSYAMMRRAIERDDLTLPKESVRIEEYVNSFKYDYPEPTGDAPVAIAAECGSCPWKKSHKLLRLGLRAKDLTTKGNLPSCNLTFLVDVSGSMDGNDRLGLAQQGLGLLVGKLRAEDHVAIVTYASGTDVRLKSTSGAEKEKIKTVIDSLEAGGCTAGGAGLELAYAEAQKNFDKSANNRVILITDGDFNVGTRGPDGLEKLIETKRASGIFLSVFGVGHGNFRDNAMKKLANAGNGNYAYLDSTLAAKKAFVDAFSGTLYTVAKDVKLQVEFNPATVGRYRLLGYENRRLEARDFNDDKKDAGEIGSGHTMTALYEIIPVGVQEEGVDPLRYQKPSEKTASEATPMSDELCLVKFRWKEPDGDTSKLANFPVKPADITAKEPSESFRFASAVAEFALLAADSKYKGEANFEDVISRAKGSRGADEDGDRAEFIRLAERAQFLVGRRERNRRD